MKGLSIINVLAFLPQFTAFIRLTSYSVTIFEKMGTTVDPYVSSIIMALALILGSLLSTYLIDILGWRILNFVSLFGSAVGLFVAACYHCLNLKGYDLTMCTFIPVMSLSFVVFISSSGIITLLPICCVENLPAKVSLFKLVDDFGLTWCADKVWLDFNSIIFRFVHLAWR